MKPWKAWLLATRPKTLSACLAPLLVGTFYPYTILKDDLQWHLSVFALLSAIFIQIGTNLFNDAFDFLRGTDTENRLGPSRVSQQKIFSPSLVIRAGVLSFLISVLFAIPLVMHGGLAIVVIGVISLIAGYAYTGGPFPLAYKGLGEVFVILFFGFVSVGGVVYLHLLEMMPLYPVLVAGLQMGLLSSSLISINNFRDQIEDKASAKRTLVVRFGPAFARYKIALFLLLPYIMLYYWYTLELEVASYLPLAGLPLALHLVFRVFTTDPGIIWNRFLARASLHYLVFSVLLSLGFYLSP